MTTQEVADQLVKLCKAGKFEDAVSTLYADDVVSVEAAAGPGQSRETKGLEGVKAKGAWWVANNEVHSAEVSEPLVAGFHFAVKFVLDTTFKPESKRMKIEEVGVYKVADGKVVYEEFLYGA